MITHVRNYAFNGWMSIDVKQVYEGILNTALIDCVHVCYRRSQSQLPAFTFDF